MSERIDIKMLSQDELDFTTWFKKLYENGTLSCKDYWESQIINNKLHHYIILDKRLDRYYHISFSCKSIVLSFIPNIKKARENIIYKGYSWKNCREIWEMHLCLE